MAIFLSSPCSLLIAVSSFLPQAICVVTNEQEKFRTMFSCCMIDEGMDDSRSLLFGWSSGAQPGFFQRYAQQRSHLILYTDGQLQLIDISSNHNLPSVLFEYVYPASCYHLRPSLCLFSKMYPPLVLSLKTVGGTCRRCKDKTTQTAA